MGSIQSAPRYPVRPPLPPSLIPFRPTSRMLCCMLSACVEEHIASVDNRMPFGPECHYLDLLCEQHDVIVAFFRV